MSEAAVFVPSLGMQELRACCWVLTGLVIRHSPQQALTYSMQHALSIDVLL